MPEPISLLDPKTGQIFEAADQDTADKQMRAYGLQIAGAEDVQTYDERQRSTTLTDKLKTVPETLAGQGAVLLEEAGKVIPQYDAQGNPVLKPVRAAEIAPFAFTPQAKERRRANEGVATAATIGTDLATTLLIPELGIPGMLASAGASGLLTEASNTLILEDEYSMKDAALAAGAAFALEGAGALAIKGAMKAKGIGKNYLDGAVDKVRRAATEGAAVETDAVLGAEKMRRNAEGLYTKHQTELDEALAEIDARTTGAPERMFTPGALKKTVSENIKAQEDAFLDLAVKFDQAAEVADVAGIAEVRATLRDALGQNGPGMYDALRTARRQLDELGDVASPLVKEAAEDLDKTLRSQPTWGKAAKNYADIADQAGDVADTVSVNIREANARDLLDQRLDRARRLNAITGDKKLAAQLKRAETALEEADKVTGARVLGETTPAEIAKLQKQVDAFPKRAPKLADDIRASHGRLNKQLGGILGEMTEDGALDYVAARASGIGGKADTVRDMFVKAEKRIAAMKAAGEDPTKIARATAELSSFRKTVAEANEIPRAAQRIRDWEARPGKGGIAGAAKRFGDDVAVDEIQNAIQPMLHGAGMTIGLHAGGIPGAALGYLGGRALNKQFGERIARWIWRRGKKGAIEFAKTNPLEAVGATVGAVGGAYMGPKGAIAGAIAGRSAASRLGKAARRAWGRGEKATAEAVGTPLAGAAKADAKATAKAARKAAREAEREAKQAAKATAKKAGAAAPNDLDPELARNLNMADHALREAQRGGDAAKISTARKAYNTALKAAGENLHTIAGAGLVGAGALAGDDRQTEGAAAASAGLLLLLLPRNIGRRAAFRHFEEAAARAARRVHGTELAPLRRAIEASRGELRATLREAAEGRVNWRPDELIEMQAQRVRQEYAAGMGRGEWRAGQHSGNMSEEADAYLKTELARVNAGWVNGDAALRRTYDQAAREADIAERAPRGDNPSPRAVQRDRVNSLQPERAARLEHDAARNRALMDQPTRDIYNDVFARADDELMALARSYASGAETRGGELLRTVDDLRDAQMAVLLDRWESAGSPSLSAEATAMMQRAAETEVAHINAVIAQQNAPARLVAPEADPHAGRVASGPADRIRSVERDVELAHDRARQQRQRLIDNGWVVGEVRQADRALGSAETEGRALFDAYVRGERYRHGDELLELGTRSDLIAAQRRIAREEFAGEAGVRADTVNPEFDAYADAHFERFNAQAARDAASRLPQPGDEGIRTQIDNTIEEMARGGENMAPNVVRLRALGNVADGARADELFEHDPSISRQARQASDNASDARAFKEAERQRNLKPPNPDERPAMVDGIPTDAAIRLDDALQDDLERLTRRAERQQNEGAGEVMLREELPAFEERARQFARDNPNLISEDDAAAYAVRRWEEIGDEEAAVRLREDGGHARSALMGEPDEDAFRSDIEDMVRDAAYDAGGDEYASLDTDRIMRRLERDNPDMTARERRVVEGILDDSSLETQFDEIVAEERARQEAEYAEENPDSEAPDSDDPPSSDGYREDYRTSRANYVRGDSDGLPSNEELERIGLRTLEVESNHGVERVFGRDLEADEVRRIFSLDYLKKYAAEHGGDPYTSLVVTPNRVEFVGNSGPFRLEQTYTASGDGLDIHYGLLKLPPEWQGKAVMKEMVRDMVEPIESLGGGEATMSSAWVGKYTWLMLGAEPSEYATQQALKTYASDLKEILGTGHPAIQMSMDRIKDTQQLAAAWLPKELVVEKLPELRQTWNEVAHKWSDQGVELQPFDEALFRTSRSGNEQFLSGKFFLMMREGEWNNGLSLKIKPGDPKYENFKKLLGMGAGVVGLGFGLHELAGAFTGTDMHISGIGGEQQETDNTPPEVLAYTDEQAAKFESVDRTREKLGYLKTESEIIVRDTARAVANAHPRARVVSGVPGVTNSKGVGAFLGSHATLREAFDDKRETLQTLQRDPMALVDELTEGLSEMQENAPALHAKMVQQTYKVVEFLQSKLPGTVGASLTRPEGSPASPIAIRQFALYYSAATDPSSVMGDLANNRVQKEQVDTLRQLWPDIYTDLKLAMVDQLSKGRPTVAQRTRMDLLFDFGDTLDRGLSNRLVAVLNQSRAQQGGQGGGEPGQGKQAPQRRTQPSIVGSSALSPLNVGPAAGPAMA